MQYFRRISNYVLKDLSGVFGLSIGSKNVNEKKDVPLTNARLEFRAFCAPDAIHGFPHISTIYRCIIYPVISMPFDTAGFTLYLL